jgi:hypothetical protein
MKKARRVRGLSNEKRKGKLVAVWGLREVCERGKEGRYFTA